MKKFYYSLLAILSIAIVSCTPEKVVYHTAPKADFTVVETTVERDATVSFTDASVPTKGTKIVSWDWNFDFANKDNTTEVSKEQSPQHAFKKNGTYEVRLVVTDDQGSFAGISKTITVVTPQKELAHASFNVSAEKTLMNAEVKFTDTSVPAEGATIKTWSWHFGESDESVSTEQNPSWTYTTSGSFTIKLEIEDTKGNKATATKDILVMDPADLISIDWKSKMLGALENTVSPAMSPDGKTVYMWADQSANNAYDVVLKAFDAETGTEKWAFNVNDEFAKLNENAGVRLVYASPAVGPNGDIYVCARDLKNSGAARKSFMLAIKADGTKHWHYAFGLDANFNYFTPAIDANGKIYVGHLTTSPYEIGIINPETGSKEKSIALTVGVRSGISLDKNGNVYFCSTGANGLFSYATSTGAQNWQYNTDFSTTGGDITIDADGTVYTVANGAKGGVLAAVKANGSQKWSYNLPAATNYGGAVLGTDGTVYANSGIGIVAVKSDGSLKWQFDVDEEVQNCVPMVDNRGYVHFITDKATYYVVTDEGTLYGKKSLGTKTFASPVMGADGKAYISAQDEDVSYVICLGTGATGYAASAWPMKGQNPQRTHLQK